MASKIRFPIRFKILIALLLVITVVVGLITFTMANLFRKDKTAYIHDLTSVVALHTAEEVSTLLESYERRLDVYLLIAEDADQPDEQKAAKLQRLFRDFPEFVAVVTYDDSNRVATTVYDDAVLRGADLTKERLLTPIEELPLPVEKIKAGHPYVRNCTLNDKLPCFLMAVAHETSDSTAPQVAVAVLRLDGFLRIAGRSRIFEAAIVTEDGTLLGHRDTGRVVRRETMDGVLEAAEGVREHGLSMTREYSVNGVDMVGGFAATGASGVLTCVQIPKSAAYLASRQLLRDLVLVALLLLVAAAVSGLAWSRRLTRPLERLSEAARFVGRGHFDIEIREESRDEIGSLAHSFNQMTGELKTREDSLAEAQAQLIQSEKMAAFGALGAGIAHEVKNPLAGILGCAQLSLSQVEKGTPLEKNLALIEKETRRCKGIIDNLLKFARQEKAEQKPFEVAPVIEDSAAIVAHQLELNKVKLEKSVAPDLPLILGNANQLQQVLMNLMINAQQAMEPDGGKVHVSAARTPQGGLELRVADNGPGIRPEHRAKLFEPFFTTKRGGKGTGLGLSVSFGIVKDHQGEITFETEVGKGTTFILTFPAHDPNAQKPPVQIVKSAPIERAPGMMGLVPGAALDPEDDPLPEWLKKAS